VARATIDVTWLNGMDSFNSNDPSHHRREPKRPGILIIFDASMRKLRATELVNVGPDVPVSMVRLGLIVENKPRALALEKDLAHVNPRVESGHGRRGK
jgi:hypothetical protein